MRDSGGPTEQQLGLSKGLKPGWMESARDQQGGQDLVLGVQCLSQILLLLFSKYLFIYLKVIVIEREGEREREVFTH